MDNFAFGVRGPLNAGIVQRGLGAQTSAEIIVTKLLVQALSAV